jgi:hypothetical protein
VLRLVGAGGGLIEGEAIGVQRQVNFLQSEE